MQNTLAPRRAVEDDEPGAVGEDGEMRMGAVGVALAMQRPTIDNRESGHARGRIHVPR